MAHTVNLTRFSSGLWVSLWLHPCWDCMSCLTHCFSFTFIQSISKHIYNMKKFTSGRQLLRSISQDRDTLSGHVGFINTIRQLSRCHPVYAVVHYCGNRCLKKPTSYDASDTYDTEFMLCSVALMEHSCHRCSMSCWRLCVYFWMRMIMVQLIRLKHSEVVLNVV